MAILRSREIREMDAEEIDNRILELNTNLMKIRGIMASGGVPEEIGKVREIRRTIARILTTRKILHPKNFQRKFLGPKNCKAVFGPNWAEPNSGPLSLKAQSGSKIFVPNLPKGQIRVKKEKDINKKK